MGVALVGRRGRAEGVRGGPHPRGYHGDQVHDVLEQRLAVLGLEVLGVQAL